jgi:hypothetical protein
MLYTAVQCLSRMLGRKIYASSSMLLSTAHHTHPCIVTCHTSPYTGAVPLPHTYGIP